MMDGMDGNGLFRRVRADSRFARVPFIFITAMSDPQERLRRLADGAADYVVKPFLIDELALKLFNLVRRAEEEKRARELERTRAFEAFLGGLAHAIRNPLSSITGPVANLRRLLEGGGADLGAQRPLRDAIDCAAKREQYDRSHPAPRTGTRLARNHGRRSRRRNSKTIADTVLQNLVLKNQSE